MRRVVTASCTAFTLALALPAGAPAASGGGNGGTAPPQSEHEAPAGQTPSGDMPVSAPRSAYVRQRVRLRGASRRARRRVVHVEARRTGGAWTTVARVRARRRGRFAVVWRPRRPGVYELRAHTGRASANGTGGTALPVTVEGDGPGPATRLTVYERAIATWYGPGFFGRTTACGIELAETTLGVAHRELPCGTRVQIAYRGRTIVAPVIDRGPYANDADWDLTQASAQQLGMTGTSRIGAMPLTPDR